MKAPTVLLFLITSCAFPTASAQETPRPATAEAQQFAIVGGQVRRSGPVEVTKNFTLYAAIQSAAGSRNSAPSEG